MAEVSLAVLRSLRILGDGQGHEDEHDGHDDEEFDEGEACFGGLCRGGCRWQVSSVMIQFFERGAAYFHRRISHVLSQCSKLTVYSVQSGIAGLAAEHRALGSRAYAPVISS